MPKSQFCGGGGGGRIISQTNTKPTDLSQGGHPHAETKFSDFSLTKFSFSLSKILRFYDLLVFSQPINEIPFPSSLKCTSRILQMKQIKSLNSFLAQNVLKLTSSHSSEWAKRGREKDQHYFHISSSQNTCYKTYLGPKLWNSLTFPRLSWYLKFPWPICKIPWLFPDLEEKPNFPDQWPPCEFSSDGINRNRSTAFEHWNLYVLAMIIGAMSWEKMCFQGLLPG